ncbi:hypothetical protein Nepgr_004240 [Nepenthes gracilis]|uniref:Uncharacterized protein n=1 Tax=Nepenthes gracilis TaxID=150966 RepID=A0AAD3XF30_NEPGR|nr:hypothetical protein Nepgr_004240 [Nepenthes gracilis]
MPSFHGLKHLLMFQFTITKRPQEEKESNRVSRKKKSKEGHIYNMKRPMRWSDDGDDGSSSDDESESVTEGDDGHRKSKAREKSNDTMPSSGKSSEVKSGKKKSGAVDFEALLQHGYKGSLSILSVPAAKEVNDPKQDWSWSTGKERATEKLVEESYEERQKTRAAIADAELLTNSMTRKKEKNVSFAQKEKRKRDLGQASRGKNYVEEEKRLLRESGVYSGFDS